MTTYWEKLKDPRWQRQRLVVLERDNWQCQLCGETESTLHVHHGHYRSKCDPWEYDDETLHAVCEGCHDDADSIRVNLQYEMAKLPLQAQDRMLRFAMWLNCVGPADINYIVQNEMPDQSDVMEIAEVIRASNL